MINEKKFTKEEILKNENKIYEIVDFFLEKDFNEIKIILEDNLEKENLKKLDEIFKMKKNDKLVFSDFTEYSNNTCRKKLFEDISQELFFEDVSKMHTRYKELIKYHLLEKVINIFFDQISLLLLKVDHDPNWINSQLKIDLEQTLRAIYKD